MRRCPRRTLIASIGTSIAVGTAGCLSEAAETGSAGGSHDDEMGEAVETLTSYLPASLASETTTVTAASPQRLAAVDEADQTVPMAGFGTVEPENVRLSVSAVSYGEEAPDSVAVLSGSIALEGDPNEETEAYDLYRDDHGEVVLAHHDDVVVAAPDVETVERAIETRNGDRDSLLEATPAFEDGLATFDDADNRSVVDDDAVAEEFDLEPDDVRYVATATTVVDEETLEVRLGVEFADGSLITDDVIDRFEDEFDAGYRGREDDVSVDDELLVATVERDLVAEREAREHDGPGGFRVVSFDPDAEYVDLEITNGDPTPVEEISLELDDEPYDREIWAGGAETIEEGDVIHVRMDDAKPNLQVTLRHDHEYGASAMTTSILHDFRFDYDYDFESRTLSMEYEGLVVYGEGDSETIAVPLDGDHLSVGVVEKTDTYRYDVEADRSSQPWTGEELSVGDTATIDDVDPGQRVIVGWDGTTMRDAVSQFSVSPPGTATVEYDFEESAASVTLETDSPRRADAYELRFDDEAARTQWTDEYETVDGRATLGIDDVRAGTRIEVVWDDGASVGGQTVHPSSDLDLRESDGPAIEHAGGDSIPTEELVAEVWTGDDRVTVELDDELDGEFEEGTIVSLGVGTVERVMLEYDGTVIGHVLSE